MNKHTLIFILLFSPGVLAASHHPQAELNTMQGTPTEGAQIVKHFCSSCHAEPPLIPLGAPRAKHPNDWTDRIKQGMHILKTHVMEGYGAMPARGGCFECTDEQLAKAIIALVPLHIPQGKP